MKGLRRSQLEEARFGVRTARVEAVRADDVPAILDFCAREHVELLIARCDAADNGAATALEDAGGRLMDTLTYWRRDLVTRAPEADVVDARVRPADPADLPAIAAIARESFHDYYGHYHADPRLPDDAASAAYADWAQRSLAGEAADVVLVAEVEGDVAAFGTFQIEPDRQCNFVLAAVAASGRQHGLYRAIAAGGMIWSAAEGAIAFYSSTQIGNLAVQKVWARLGMELSGAVHTFHRWA